MHCPFCRRQIAQLGVVQPRLAAEGVETIAVVNTPLERARLYFRYRPTELLLLSDPDTLSLLHERLWTAPVAARDWNIPAPA